jgi:hypothetical protein
VFSSPHSEVLVATCAALPKPHLSAITRRGGGPYICGCGRRDIRRTSSRPSARAWTGGRSDGTACASCCGAYRTPRYPCQPYPVDPSARNPSALAGEGVGQPRSGREAAHHGGCFVERQNTLPHTDLTSARDGEASPPSSRPQLVAAWLQHLRAGTISPSRVRIDMCDTA